MWGVGNVLAAVGPHNVLWWDLTYGVLGGLGNGMAYITPVATVTKWFPDKRGLASGMVVMGFGLGAFFYGFVLKAIPGFVALAHDAGVYADAKSAAVINHTVFDPATVALTAADVGSISSIVLYQRHRLRDRRRTRRDAAASNPPAGYSGERRCRVGCRRMKARIRRRKCCACRNSTCCG